jgi:hypothetical protein
MEQPMTKVVSMRLREDQVARLGRVARRMGRSPSETSAMLVEEGLRRVEFALIDFRESPIGRQAYVQGSTLAVWEVVLVAQDFGLDAEKTAEHLGWTVPRVRAALNYAAAHADEIGVAIADYDEVDLHALERLVPATTAFDVHRAGH